VEQDQEQDLLSGGDVMGWREALAVYRRTTVECKSTAMTAFDNIDENDDKQQKESIIPFHHHHKQVRKEIKHGVGVCATKAFTKISIQCVNLTNKCV